MDFEFNTAHKLENFGSSVRVEKIHVVAKLLVR